MIWQEMYGSGRWRAVGPIGAVTEAITTTMVRTFQQATAATSILPVAPTIDGSRVALYIK